MRRWLLAAAAAFALLSPAPASAATILYKLSALVHGTHDTQQFYDYVTFTGAGDTTQVVQVDGLPFLQLSGLTMTSGGQTFHATTPSWFAVNAEYGIGGLIFADTTAQNALTGYGDALLDYDLRTPLGQAYLDSFWPMATFDTDQGSFAFDSAEDLVFSAAILSAPEPAAWGMMLIGFAIIGGVMRRSRAPACA